MLHSWQFMNWSISLPSLFLFIAHLTGELVTSLGGGLVSVSCGIQG